MRIAAFAVKTTMYYPIFIPRKRGLRALTTRSHLILHSLPSTTYFCRLRGIESTRMYPWQCLEVKGRRDLSHRAKTWAERAGS